MRNEVVGEAITPLRLRAIGKRFGRLAVLRGVDLEVRAGEVVGLVGANGAGKTTLLSIVAGLEQPTEGVRSFGDESDASVAPDLRRRARMALVTHTAQVYPRLTARENLELFVDLRRAAGFDAADPDALLTRLGLADARDRMAGTFSRGMLQRLALARALLGLPDLLLLDEPFTALDRPGRALLSRVILEERERGAAVLLSSHDFDAIGATTDRVVLLEGGRLVGVAERSDRDDPEGVEYRARVQGLAGRLPHAEVARA
jgi:ABC-type multidrug transport system ATPase subunit